jgi:hypothetical protein
MAKSQRTNVDCVTSAEGSSEGPRIGEYLALKAQETQQPKPILVRRTTPDGQNLVEQGCLRIFVERADPFS